MPAPAVRLGGTTFAPTRGELPDLPPHLLAPAPAAGRSTYYLVQFGGPVLESWKSEVAEIGAEFLDYAPDFAFKVRMNPGQAARVERLPSVTWVGPFHPGYKLAPALVRDQQRAYTVRVERGTNVGATVRAIEDTGARILQRRGRVLTVSADTNHLDLMAQVADVASIENFLLRSKLNEYGGGVILGADVANSSGFDGSTQTIAIADTGLGGGTAATAHAHLPSTRISGLFNRPGSVGGCFTSIIDDGAVDVDTGHGTHTATSAVGGGGPLGEGRGTAPGANLVFQAIENWASVSLFCGLFGATDGYYLTGIPSDLGALFQQGYDAGARVHSNSWGSAANGAYTSDAMNADAFVWNQRDLTITFAAGNSGTDADSNGIVDSGSIGSPATAKNVISIGASENDRELHWECDPSLTYTECAAQGGQNDIFTYGSTWPTRYAANPLKDDPSAGNGEQMASFSSRGPTSDGRIKPDVVAPGTWVLSGYSSQFPEGYSPSPNPQDGQFQYDGWGLPRSSDYKYMGGTSMANPLVAGAAAVVRDFYRKTSGHDASAALVKATLVNSAVDLLDENNDGISDNAYPVPNAHEGWGRVNLTDATDGSQRFTDEATALSTNLSSAFSFPVSASGSAFKVTLAWSDYPGSLSAATALVNDLDLKVTAPDGTVHLGNVFSGGWSQPGGTPDRLNNLENVFIEAADAGTWTVEVLAFNVPVGPQPFALVVDGQIDGPGTELPSVVVNVVDPVATEAGPTPGTLTMTRSGDTATALVASYLVAGTAIPDVDYDALSGTVTFAVDVSTISIVVTPLDDLTIEPDETVVVTISPGSTYSIGSPPGGTVTIESDDVPADLVVTALTVPSGAAAGDRITVTETTANQGGGPSDASATGFYLSTNTIVDGSDVLLNSRPVPALDVGDSHSAPTELLIPLDATPGHYRLIAVADVDGLVAENNENNNHIVSPSVKVGADLMIAVLTAPGAATPGGTIDVTETTTNVGAGDASASETRFYLSTNFLFDASDVLLGSRSVGPLDAGADNTATTALPIPANTPTGSYYLLARADGTEVIVEATESNNVKFRGSVKVGVDLAVPMLTVPGTATAGSTINVTETTANTGTGGAAASETRFYLSTNFLFDAGDVPVGGRSVGPLDAGADDTATTVLLVPANTAAGSYYLLARADGTDLVAESSESNNVTFRTIGVMALSAPTNLAATAGHQEVSLTWTGVAGATGYRVMRSLTPGGGYVSVATGVTSTTYTDTGLVEGTPYYYVVAAVNDTAESGFSNEASATPGMLLPDAPANLSAIAGDGDVSLTWSPVGGSGISYTVKRSQTAGGPFGGIATGLTMTSYVDAGVVNGTQYVYVVTAVNAVGESLPSNEVAAIPETPVSDADLTISLLTAPARAAAGSTIDATETTANIGTGRADASETTFYLSTNFLFDASDVLIGSRSLGPLAAGTDDAAATTLLIPTSTAPGSYYLLARADGTDVLVETSESNNVKFRGPIKIGADLTVSALTAPGTAGAGGTLIVTDTTANTGTGDADASETFFYLSTNFLFDASDVLLGSRRVGPLAAGAGDTSTTPVPIPVNTVAGSYYLLARADGAQVVAESSESNNVAFRGSVKIGADLVISVLTVPGTAESGGTIDATDTTANAGAGDADASETRFYLSTNLLFDAGDVVLGSRSVGPLAAGTDDTTTTALLIPATTAAGSYYLLARADGTDVVPETSESNNIRFRALSVTVPNGTIQGKTSRGSSGGAPRARATGEPQGARR